MGLTALVFLTPLVLFSLWTRARPRIQETVWNWFFLMVAASFSIFAVSLGLSYLAAQPYSTVQPVPLFLSRLSAGGAAAGYIVLFRACLSFPYGTRNFAADLAATAAISFALYVTVGTPLYLVHVERVHLEFIREGGVFHGSIAAIPPGIGLLGAAILAARILSLRSRIFQQQCLLLALGTAASASLDLLSGTRPPQIERLGVMVPAISPVLLGVGYYWAVTITRILAWREIGRKLLAYAALAVLIGIPTGAAVTGVMALRLPPPIPAIAAAACFALGALAASAFVERFLNAIAGRRRYRDALQAALARVDLAGGREAVLKETHSILSAPMGFSDFTVLSADDEGNLRTVYSSYGGDTSIKAASQALSELAARGVAVLLKTDAVANRSFSAFKQELLAVFESLRAETLILAHEGRKTLGMFALGQRLSGGDYTTYDYETLRAVYGKLFVVLYYVKNIARESVLATVDREIEFSDQIIESLLENVDRIEHPKADVHFIASSARKLGGDFIDLVRIGQDQYFFVVGDVSGKGLNASMSMIILKTMIRNFLKEEKNFSRIAERVNALIKDNLPRGTFFAGVFGYFDFSRDSLFFINCGIPVMLMYSTVFNTVIDIQGEGRVLGFVRDVRPYLKLRRVPLYRDSVLLLSTDGILESENLRGERYGKERLRRAVWNRRAQGARDIASGLLEDLMAYTDNRQEDDITLFALRIQAETKSPA